jgi:hypothetical protein
MAPSGVSARAAHPMAVISPPLLRRRWGWPVVSEALGGVRPGELAYVDRAGSSCHTTMAHLPQPKMRAGFPLCVLKSTAPSFVLVPQRGQGGSVRLCSSLILRPCRTGVIEYRHATCECPERQRPVLGRINITAYAPRSSVQNCSPSHAIRRRQAALRSAPSEMKKAAN